ncbi:MAG: glycosyltransferase family 2 protein [Candidatus Omnitrophica bacterium]|nr:glycosyltransferase family 2 protein [Candidatus Omnitrophota bacterium]
METKFKVAVVIPAHNEETAIGKLIKDLQGKVNKVIVVNDGSTDSTAKEAENKGAVVLHHQKRRGKGEALKTGFNYILENEYQAVITMDGDGQHLPSEVHKFVETFEKGPDNIGMIIGLRRREIGRMPLDRLLTNWFTSSAVSFFAHQRIPDSQCGFRLIRREALKGIKLLTSHFDTESEILVKIARKGFQILSIPIKTVYQEEKSKIDPFVDTLRFFKFVFNTALKR